MDIIGYEGLYKIYDDGSVYSLYNNRFLKLCIDSSGYLRANLCKNGKNKTTRVHKLVTRHFIGERPNGMDIDHKDKNKLNNKISNLRYVTRSENMKNKFVSGKIPYRNIGECCNGFRIDIWLNRKCIFRKCCRKWSLEDAIKVRNEAYIKLGIEIDDSINQN